MAVRPGALGVAMLAGCFGMPFLGTPAFEPVADTPENRLYSGFEEPTCEQHAPEDIDEAFGTLLVGGAVVALVYPGDPGWNERSDLALALAVPGALFWAAAAWQKHAISECRDVQRRSDAERSAKAAGSGDCTTVRSLELRIRQLQPDYHRTVFLRDPAVRRCLGLNAEPPPPLAIP